MKSDSFSLPSGQSLRKVRDILRRHNAFTNTKIATHFDADITNDLIASGLIEAWEEFRGHFPGLIAWAPLGQRQSDSKNRPREGPGDCRRLP
jgi:hypothetical protein